MCTFQLSINLSDEATRHVIHVPFKNKGISTFILRVIDTFNLLLSFGIDLAAEMGSRLILLNFFMGFVRPTWVFAKGR